MHHQAEAVRDVNMRISTNTAHLDDALIIAVSLLANCEVGNCNGPSYFSY
jgi:hypothetical protein